MLPVENKVKREINVVKNYSLSEIEKMAEYVATSGLFGVKDKKQAVALLLLAQSEGLHPMMAVRKYHIIQGRPSKSAETMLAEFKQVGGKVKWHRLDNEVADATFISPDGDEVRIKWTLEDAKRAGLLNRDNWQKYPRAMLRSRVVSEGIRIIYPQIVLGVYTPDEVIDIVENDNNTIDATVENKAIDNTTVTNEESYDKVQVNQINEAEKLEQTLAPLGMSLETKDGFAKVAETMKGAIYQNRQLLKELGFKFAPNKKIWYKKIA